MSKLLEALMAAQYQPEQDPFGIAGTAIAAGAPGLYNPYASTGRNAIYTGGAALLAGLLGGIAANRTEQRNAELVSQMRGLMRGTPEQREEAVKNNPRLASVVTALQGDEIQRERELEQKRQELALQTQQQRGNKLYEALLERGQVAGQDGTLTQLFSPAEDKAREAQMIEEAKLKAQNASQPTIPQLVNIPPQYRDEAYKELVNKETGEKAIAEIDGLYEQAKTLPSIEMITPFTGASKQAAAINNALASIYQKSIGREMNAADRENLDMSLIKASDTPSQIEEKKKVFISSLQAMRGATPILDQFQAIEAPSIPTPLPNETEDQFVQRVMRGG